MNELHRGIKWRVLRGWSRSVFWCAERLHIYNLHGKTTVVCGWWWKTEIGRTRCECVKMGRNWQLSAHFCINGGFFWSKFSTLRVVKPFCVHQMEIQRWRKKLTAYTGGTDAAETLRMCVFNDPSSFAYCHHGNMTLPYSFTTCSLPLQQSVPYYEQQLERDILIKRRCPKGEVKNMYYISNT